MYSNESTELPAYREVNANTQDKKAIIKINNESRPGYVACEVDRCIRRSKNGSECNGASLGSSYKRCVDSSSDEMSNKRKIVVDIDMSTISLTPTNISSGTNNNKNRTINFSIPISSFDKLGEDAEFSLKISEICNGKSKQSSTSSKNKSKWEESKGKLRKKEWQILR